jgi:hypothetical protein
MEGGGRLEISLGAHVTPSAARNALEETYALEQAAGLRRSVSRRSLLQGDAVEQPDEPDEAREGKRSAGFAGYPGVVRTMRRS